MAVEWMSTHVGGSIGEIWLRILDRIGRVQEVIAGVLSLPCG